MTARNKGAIDVLMISRAYPPASGGVAVHTYYLANALSRLTNKSQRRTCRVQIITARALGDRVEVEEKSPLLVIRRLPGRNYHFASQGEIPFEPAIEYCLDKWRSQGYRPDLIHAQDFEGIQIGMLLKAAHEVPLIATIHRTPKEPWDEALPKRNIKDCFMRFIQNTGCIDMMVAPSRAYKEYLVEQGFSEEKVRLIYHGIPIRFLESSTGKSDILERLNLQPEHEIILCPVRLDPHKAPDIFTDAAGIIRKRLPDRKLAFVIAGSGSDEALKKVQRQARECGVDEIFRIIPAEFDEMPVLYRRAKICVLPSRREGLGQVVLEAAVFKVPMIAANTGGIPEIVISGKTGLLFNRDEAEDLADQIQALLEDDNLAEELANRDRGEPYDSAPPTPPGIRVRTMAVRYS